MAAGVRCQELGLAAATLAVRHQRQPCDRRAAGALALQRRSRVRLRPGVGPRPGAVHARLAHPTSQGRPTFNNPIFGESLYELCRKATTRQIDYPDDILNQQVRSAGGQGGGAGGQVVGAAGRHKHSAVGLQRTRARARLRCRSRPGTAFLPPALPPQIVHMINEERATPMAAAVSGRHGKLGAARASSAQWHVAAGQAAQPREERRTCGPCLRRGPIHPNPGLPPVPHLHTPNACFPRMLSRACASA